MTYRAVALHVLFDIGIHAGEGSTYWNMWQNIISTSYIPACNTVTQLWKVGAIYISSFAVNLVGWRCIWFVSNVINSDDILNRQWRIVADPLEGIGHLATNKLLWSHSAPLQSSELSSSRHLGIFIRHSLIVNSQGSFLVYL